MSTIKHYKGRIREVDYYHCDLEDLFSKVAKDHNITELNSYSTWQELVLTEFSDEYIFVRGTLYKIIDKNELKDINTFILKRHNDGIVGPEYAYEVCYDNDELTLADAIQNAFNNI